MTMSEEGRGGQGVEWGGSCRGDAVPEPAASAPGAPAMPPGGEELGRSVGRMRGSIASLKLWSSVLSRLHALRSAVKR